MRYLYITLIILIFGLFGLLNPVREFSQWVFAPFQFGLRDIATSLKDGASFYTDLKNVRNSNLELLEENLTLKALILEMKQIREENEVLREQMDIEGTSDRNLLLANLMGNHEDITGTTFVMDKGSVHGVQVGDNVIKGKYLVGIVREVTKQRSLADFLTSSNVSVAVYDIDVPERTEGLAEGQHGSSILMKRILPNENISERDTIVTSGKDGIFLPGLYVGEVKEVIEIPADPLKSAYLETGLDFSKLNKVFILVDL